MSQQCCCEQQPGGEKSENRKKTAEWDKVTGKNIRILLQVYSYSIGKGRDAAWMY